jgi:hypothetical protein
MTAMAPPFEGPISPVVDWETNRMPPRIVVLAFLPPPRLRSWPASIAPTGKAPLRPPLGPVVYHKTADQTPRKRHPWEWIEFKLSF